MVTHVRIGDVDNRYALHRLAGKARQDGIRLYRDNRGRYFASSASQAGVLHYVTAVSCDCPGFFHHGRCKHHAALMSALGWVDGTPDPEPGVNCLTPDEPASCPTCHGTGVECGTVSTGPGKWAYGSIVCGTCHGTGTAVAA